MQTKTLAAIIGAALALIGCGHPTEKELVIVLLEQSKTYVHLQDGIRVLTGSTGSSPDGVLKQLHSGDVVAVIPISRESNRASPVIAPTLVDYQQFHDADKRQFIARQAALLAGVKLYSEPGIDLMGALQEATRVLTDPLYKNFRHKRLVVISDLQDTVNKRVHVDFSGVDVSVLFFQDEPGAGKVSPNAWQSFFTHQCFARSAEIRAPIVSSNFRI